MSLHIGFTIGPPDTYPCTVEPNSSCTRHGMAYEVALMTCRYLHLNCTFSLFNRKEFGDYDEESGNVTGLIGEIYRGNYDTGLPVLTPTYSRWHVVSFTNSYFYDNIVLITRAPNRAGISWDVVHTFQTTLWIVVLMTLILIALLITILEAVPCRSIPTVCFDNILYLITRQYHVIKQGTRPLLFLVTFWAGSYIILASSYTGALFSQKVISGIKLPFTNLDTFADCIVSSQCTMLSSTLSSSPVQFMMAKDNPVSSKLRKAFVYNPIMIIPSNETPVRILEEREKYLVWVTPKRSYLNYIMKNEDKACLYYAVTLPFGDNCAFAVRKNSSLFRPLNRMANLFRETGLFRQIEEEYLLREMARKECTQSPKESVHVEFIEISTVFVFYAVGNAVAVLLLFLEIHWKRCR